MNDKESLKSYFENILSITEEKWFFLALYDYVAFVVKNDQLARIITETIEQTRQEIILQNNELNEKVKNETAAYLTEIQNYLAHKSIHNEEIIQDLRDYDSYINRQVTRSEPLGITLHRLVCSIVDSLFRSNHEAFVLPNVTIDKTGIVSYNFSPTYFEFKRFLEHRKYQRDNSIWGHWGDIYLVYEILSDKEEILHSIEKEGNTIKLWDYMMLSQELKAIVNEEKTERIVIFKVAAFRIMTQRIHAFFIHQLNETRSSPPKSSNKLVEVMAEQMKRNADTLPGSQGITCGKVILNLDYARLTITGHSPKEKISRSSQEVRLLEAVMKKAPYIAKYHELAETLELVSYKNDYSGTPLNREVQNIARKTKNLLVSAGLSQKEADEIFICIRNEGYKIVVDPAIKT